jgi:CBS domain-containing protein
MKASDVMTTEVVSVAADTPTREVAKVLADRGISAVPVVDAVGARSGISRLAPGSRQEPP